MLKFNSILNVADYCNAMLLLVWYFLPSKGTNSYEIWQKIYSLQWDSYLLN